MGTPRPDDAAAKLRTAIEMHEMGVALMEQNLRRMHPEEPEEAIAARLRAWLHEAPLEPGFRVRA
jgi:hypothetical protein